MCRGRSSLNPIRFETVLFQFLIKPFRSDLLRGSRVLTFKYILLINTEFFGQSNILLNTGADYEIRGTH